MPIYKIKELEDEGVRREEGAVIPEMTYQWASFSIFRQTTERLS